MTKTAVMEDSSFELKHKSDKVDQVDDDGKPIDSWRIDSAINTLQEAEEIKKNKALMAAIQPKLAKKREAIESISDLVEKRDKLRREGR